MGVQKFDGIQEKIEGGKNSSLTTILSIWNCVMGSSLLSHGSYLPWIFLTMKMIEPK